MSGEEVGQRLWTVLVTLSQTSHITTAGSASGFGETGLQKERHSYAHNNQKAIDSLVLVFFVLFLILVLVLVLCLTRQVSKS